MDDLEFEKVCALIRRVLDSGDDRQGLRMAKDLYSERNSPRSKELLLEAYTLRCQKLRQRGLTVEAESIAQLAIERFPEERARFELAKASVGPSWDFVGPLADTNLSPERRSEIELRIESTVTDLHGLAACGALPEDHPLRIAARALHGAFEAATSRPVSDSEIALNEVSRRSPLAQWKLLIRGIALFHRGDTAGSLETLGLMKAETAASRAVPVLRLLIKGEKGGTAAERKLVNRIRGDRADLRKAVERLEKMLRGRRDAQVVSAVRDLMPMLRDLPEERLRFLKRQIFAQCVGKAMPDEVRAALGGLDEDSEFQKTLARRFQYGPDLRELQPAASYWSLFLKAAGEEGKFAPDSLEAAIVHREIAELLVQAEDGGPQMRRYRTTLADLEPGYHFARACEIDPSAENHGARIRWLKSQKGKSRDVDAAHLEWHKAVPSELEPVLGLMRSAHVRKAFQKAMSWLVVAEALDPLHAEVRRARIRIVLGNVLQSIGQGKAPLALSKLAHGEKDPAAQLGDRPAVFAALSYLMLEATGQAVKAHEARAKVLSAMGDELGAATLIYALGVNHGKGPSPPHTTAENSLDAPKAIARTVAAMDDLSLSSRLPREYLVGAETAYRKKKPKLAVREIECLAQVAIYHGLNRFAFELTGDGIALGQVTEAYFLFLRSRAVIENDYPRSIVVLSAALHLAREHRDQRTVDRILALESTIVRMDAETVDRVRREERKAKTMPGRGAKGPDYSDLAPRNPFGGFDPDAGLDEFDPFDPDFEPDFDDMPLPDGMPAEIAKILLEAVREGARSGDSPEEVMRKILGKRPPTFPRRRKR